ncbi:hypothetical protein RQM65_14285 [Pricia sp. S334]|uniref:Uncharacterized protein n=1 Tax=Pricia mediterranea TaxID=3076079 RepID=A0ABU3L9G8_9FLAO|nr:hypothetical protein [Pricia sp. S334]MDT7829839.1 hypothetical protein [Pricia sp. S334]
MQNLLRYLKFLFTATNQHGVHSPFIYAYVTKCLYAQPGYGGAKSEDILLKSIAYFKPKRVWLPPDKNKLRKTIQHEFPSVLLCGGPYDIIYADPLRAEKLLGNPSEENKIHNDCMMLIFGIRSNADHRATWKRIKTDHQIRITVDLFHCAAAFFRREQAEEHFQIRI